MTVGELLQRADSRELTEWQAYEAVVGPLGGGYRDNVLAAIHEELQVVARLVGGQYKKNPAPKPKPYPRPDELYDFVKNHKDDDDVVPRSFGVEEEG